MTHNAEARKIQRLIEGRFDWRAHCEACGWYGVTQETKTEADKDAAEHNEDD